ncbi:MAG: Rrf2 family transcriptional regulator [Cloacibacillus sp.]
MMMTRETDYAVRILRALSSSPRLSLRQICASELIPVQFAYKILKKLDKGGYVEVFRGAEGGCSLKADLSSVTLYDLLACINEEFLINACMSPSHDCQWRKSRCGTCRVHDNLKKIQFTIDEELKKHTLDELLNLP